jgi:hypothetical protein
MTERLWFQRKQSYNEMWTGESMKDRNERLTNMIARHGECDHCGRRRRLTRCWTSIGKEMLCCEECQDHESELQDSMRG